MMHLQGQSREVLAVVVSIMDHFDNKSVSQDANYLFYIRVEMERFACH